MARNTRNYPPRDIESLKDTIKKLRGQLRRLKKENAELVSENRTLLSAWAETESFLFDVTDNASLEDLLNKKNLKKEPNKVKMKKEPEDERENVRQKWAKWNEERKKGLI